jgi:signal transduction histidine kinase/ActR/RegA family two-component response regulator
MRANADIIPAYSPAVGTHSPCLIMSKYFEEKLSVFDTASAEELLTLAPFSEKVVTRAGRHSVQFYESDSFLLDSVTSFLHEGIRSGDACIVIASQPHREKLAARLLGHGLDVVNDGLGEQYYSFDAQETLSQMLIGDAIQPALFTSIVGDIVKQVSAQGRRVRAFGEMVALLAAGGNYQAAIDLEQCWNRLQQSHEFMLLCAYSMTNFDRDVANSLAAVCDVHSEVNPCESYNTLSGAEERLRAIVVLQQKARTLESEIAERKKVELALRAATDELKKLLVSEQLARAEAVSANRMKDEFLATVSHELRTPLNAIIGWTHMLGKGKLDQALTARAIETIERNAKAQAQLVEDILDVSRVITGKLQLNIGPADVASIINAAIDSVQPAATSKAIEIEVTLDPLIRHIAADANRLQQIVWNLLANAIKFTPPGGHVNVSLKRKAANVQITVSDTGKGIDPAFVPFIFDRFRQEDASTTRSYGGLGLGLSIVRHLAELHGGTVEAYSGGEGKGATFTILLPNLRPADKPKTRKIRSTSSAVAGNENLLLPVPSIAGRRILLVDDDADTLRMLSEVLSERCAVVESANSVQEAIEILARFQADVVVSDLAMPEKDGYSLIETIRGRETEATGLLQAIALTALVRIEDRARALSAGFNMFLAKPVQPNELISAIANLTETVS